MGEIHKKHPTTTMSTDAEYIKLAGEAWEEAVEIAKSEDGWKEEKNDKKTGDTVESKKNKKGRKIYRCKARINIPPKLLIAAISDTDSVTTWNTTLTEARVLKTLNDECAFSYQVTCDGGGGMVSARDFVYASKKGYVGEVFVMGGLSVDYKGWLPQSVLDIAMPSAQVQFIECIRKMAQKQK